MVTIGKTSDYAAQLRQNTTDAERRLWHHLRNRALGGFKFRRQVTIGRCISDFACVRCKVIIEADGGQHCDEVDRERTAYLERLGWRVLRFWNNDILQQTDAVLERILTACQQSQEGKPSPCPLAPAGEGE